MISKHQEARDKVTVHFEAGKKAFHEAMAKAHTHIEGTTAEINRLRADLKTHTAEAKTKTMAHIDELTKKLDAARKEQQEKIEARLKELDADIESINAELKHATGAGKVAMEAKAKVAREEYDFARNALTTSLDAELVEWKARIGATLDAAAEKKAEAAKAAVQAKIADMQAKHEAAQKKLHSLKQANAAAFDELQRGVSSAIADVKTAVQHARAHIAAS